MSQSVITNAFSPWLAARLAEGKPARPDQMVFAWIEGQDENAEISPDEQLPAESLIKHTADIIHFGTLNERAFVCSVVLDTTIGSWRYNWIGLVDSESGTLLMIVHTAEQQKIRTAAGIQGNTLSRNLMMEFSGAAAASQITVTAETWQIDFSARLRSLDESRRVARTDYYGEAAFRDDSFFVTATGGVLHAAPGLGYVAGLRVELTEATAVAAISDTGVWVDVVWSGTVTGAWASTFTLRTGEGLTDYTDAAGFQHYVTQIADVRNGTVTDLRLPFPLQRLEHAVDELDVYSREESDDRFLQKGNNLSDIPDAAAAREHLGISDAEGAGFRAIIDAVFWVGRTVISDSNPQALYDWQTWQDLSDDHDGRVLRIGDAPGGTGGQNEIKIEADNLPPHWHRSGDRSPGSVWDPDTTHGTDNQKSGPLALTEGTYADASGQTETTNRPINVTNRYVTVRVWKRTA
ncbi:phage tail protein [Klebsiella variicola]|uniref:phage tail-collar fiber domain-containing protein n=1 Tax=Klebsiella variicola TaxID=244366 RepID=UPI0034A48D10